jgi:hypothetical protein
MHPFFKDDDFQFATENVLGGVFHRAADVGEVLATIDNIPNGKAAAWVEQWTATADRLAGQAAADAEAGRLRSAAARYLRAANYYSEASDKADATPDPALFTAPRGPIVDGPVVVQQLPALAPGHYTVGVQVLDHTGHPARGTFGFTVDPAVVRAAGPGGSGTDGSGSSGDAAWIVPAAATALLLPATLLALRRRRR